MAKHRKKKAHKAGRKGKMPAGLRKYWAKKRGRKASRKRHAKKSVLAIAKPRRRSKKHGKRRAVYLKSVRITGMVAKKNPLGGFIRIPSTQELVAVGMGALLLPAVTNLVTNLSFMPSMLKKQDGKDTWGSLATGLVLGSVASVVTKKYISGAAGDVIFVLTLANTAQGAVKMLVPDMASKYLGLGEGELGAEESLGYYENAQLGAYDGSGSGFGESLPEMV